MRSHGSCVREQEPPTVGGVATFPHDEEAAMADVDYDLVVIGGGRCVGGTKRRWQTVGWNGGRANGKRKKKKERERKDPTKCHVPGTTNEIDGGEKRGQREMLTMDNETWNERGLQRRRESFQDVRTNRC